MGLLEGFAMAFIVIMISTFCFGGLMFLGDYLTYRDLQRRLKKEREVKR